MDTLRTVVLVAATIAGALQAGTYYIWAIAIIPGLARADDRTFVSVLRYLNRAIVNPAFVLTFLGAPALAVLGAVLVEAPSRPWTIAAAALAGATLIVTIAANIPLNERLDRDTRDPASARAAFLSPWQWWNGLRAITSTGAVGLLAVAMLQA